MNYLPVRLSTLKPGVSLMFNVYVQLPHKFVLYSREGMDMEQESINRFKKKKVRKLFIEENDESKYQAYLDARLNQAVSDPNASLEEKTEAAVGTAQSASDQVYEKPGEHASYAAAKRASSGLLKILREKQEALKLILERGDIDDSDPVEKMRIHAVNTCSLAIRFGEYLGLNDNELEELGVAGLYHDIAFSQYPDDIKECFFKDFSRIDGKRLGAYKEHPRKAVEVLQDKPFASSGVLDLILTHEERLGGKGFAQGLQKLSVMQEVHALCCHYDREVTCLGKNPKVVVEDFTVNGIGQFNLDTLKKFKSFWVQMGF